MANQKGNKVLIYCIDDDRKLNVPNDMRLREMIDFHSIDRTIVLIPDPKLRYRKKVRTGGESTEQIVNVSEAIRRHYGECLSEKQEAALSKLDKTKDQDEELYETLKGIGPKIPGLTFKDDENIFDVDTMMRTLNELIMAENELESTVYVSIAEGSPEYIAAASIVAMLNKKSIIGGNSGGDMFFDGQEGTMAVREPFKEVKPLNIKKPDETEMKCLKIFSSFDEPSQRSNTNVVHRLIWTGLWNEKKTGNRCETFKQRTRGTSLKETYYDPSLEPDPESDRNTRLTDEKLPLDPNEANIYHRHYITRWNSKDFRWIEHISHRTDKYKVTKEAERMLRIFCSDKIFDIQKELDNARDPNGNNGNATGQ